MNSCKVDVKNFFQKTLWIKVFRYLSSIYFFLQILYSNTVSSSYFP